MLQQRQDWINSILDNLSSKENNDSLASYILVVVKLINEQEILTGLDTEEWSLELKSSLQKWCSRINSLLTSKNDVQKWAGAILLSLTISSSDKLFKDHWKSWFNLLFTNLKVKIVSFSLSLSLSLSLSFEEILCFKLQLLSRISEIIFLFIKIIYI